jgi:hypothetical protein
VVGVISPARAFVRGTPSLLIPVLVFANIFYNGGSVSRTSLYVNEIFDLKCRCGDVDCEIKISWDNSSSLDSYSVF